MHVFITKYALTKGIQECTDASVCDPYQDTIRVKYLSGVGLLTFDVFFHGQGDEWHKSRESAVIRANEMVSLKISSLEKQLVKLKKKQFV